MFGHSHPTGVATILLAATRRFEPEALAYTHSRSCLDDESLPHRQPPEADTFDEPDHEASARFVGGLALLPRTALAIGSLEPPVFDILPPSQSRS